MIQHDESSSLKHILQKYQSLAFLPRQLWNGDRLKSLSKNV